MYGILAEPSLSQTLFEVNDKKSFNAKKIKNVLAKAK